MLTEREKFISIVDNDLLSLSDAIILLEGDGLNRYSHAVDLYKKGLAPLILFSGAIVNYKYGSFPFPIIREKIIDLGVNDADLLHEDVSLNTKEQADQVIKIALEKKWSRLILVASCEHQYRAYLTFLRPIIDLKTNIILFNSAPRNLSWFEQTEWGIRYERLDQEFERIDTYSKLGHLATYKEAIDYQRWKEKIILKK